MQPKIFGRVQKIFERGQKIFELADGTGISPIIAQVNNLRLHN